MSISVTENIDCMEFMAKMPDKFFDLAIVDPPYGIGNTVSTQSQKIHKKIDWNDESPRNSYFRELERVSKNRIIWGATYYKGKILDEGIIVHDKTDGGRIVFPTSISECDIASHSFGVTCRIFRWGSKGNIDGMKINWDNVRIHPHQKPVYVYSWCLTNFAKPGQKILDTHLGSGSSRIAAYDLGFDFWGTELDKDYFEAQEKRFATHIAQGRLFEPSEISQPIQEQLF